MSLHPSSESNNGVLVFIDADSKADLQALCGFLKAGLVKEEPERLAEGRFVVSLRPGVHYVVVAIVSAATVKKSRKPVREGDPDRPLSRMLAGEFRAISYRPELVKIAGSVPAAILAQQVAYWASRSQWRPFFKFRAPCGHEDFRPGDSWTEELAFTGHEFDAALRKIATKVTTGKSKTDALEKSLVVYWTDSSRKTWFLLNWQLLEKRLGEVYAEVEDA